MRSTPTRVIGVLVTRPLMQSKSLCARIEGLGWRAISFPAVEIQLIESEPSSSSTHWDILIFVSKNAVIHGVHLLGGRTAGSWVAAVGEGTAGELRQRGIKVDLIPDKRWDSEGLLAHPELHGVANKKILIVRGQGGRPLLGDSLTERGAEVEYAEVYHRVLPQVNASSIINGWRDQIDMVVTTSNEILENLFQLLGDEGGKLLKATPLVVISERGYAYAQKRGCQSMILAEGASDEAVISAMLGWYENANLDQYRDPRA